MRTKCIKIIVVFAFTFGIVYMSNAQEIGVRFGGINGSGGVSADAMFKAGQYSRFHADLGLYKNGMGLDILWDFVNRPLGNEALNWYLGIGPSTYIGNNSWLGASGEIGLEYRLNAVPIAIGVDWRPTYWLANKTGFGADSFGINLRIVF